MAALPKLEIVACYGVGTDAIDLTHARAAGIRVTNTPDVLTDDVADIAVALLLAAARRLPQGDAEVRRGGWAGNAAHHPRLRQAGRHRRHGPDRRRGRAAARRLRRRHRLLRPQPPRRAALRLLGRSRRSRAPVGVPDPDARGQRRNKGHRRREGAGGARLRRHPRQRLARLDRRRARTPRRAGGRHDQGRRARRLLERAGDRPALRRARQRRAAAAPRLRHRRDPQGDGPTGPRQPGRPLRRPPLVTPVV